MLNQLDYPCGVNPAIMDYLKEKFNERDEKDKLCTLMFDETSIRKNIQYIPSMDKIFGFVDRGSSRHKELSTTCLTFMLQGLHKSWRQPIAFYFENKISATNMASKINEVILAVSNCGLKIMATVCDMGTNNAKAKLKISRNFSYIIGLHSKLLTNRLLVGKHYPIEINLP